MSQQCPPSVVEQGLLRPRNGWDAASGQGSASLTAPGREAKAPAGRSPGRTPSLRLVPEAGLPPRPVPSLLQASVYGTNVIRDNGIMALSQAGGLTLSARFVK